MRLGQSCWAPELRLLNDHLLKWIFPAIFQQQDMRSGIPRYDRNGDILGEGQRFFHTATGLTGLIPSHVSYTKIQDAQWSDPAGLELSHLIRG